jgi:multisubunit Na+/H+ antiporter MnhB subunit
MSTRNIVAAIFFAIVAIFLIYSVSNYSEIHDFGDPDQYIEPEMDQYIINNTQNETGADNGVTAVVFDYRGFDTLGEATVLFTAVAGVILIFRRLKK